MSKLQTITSQIARKQAQLTRTTDEQQRINLAIEISELMRLQASLYQAMRRGK